ncbi:MAG: hypothetical protein K2N94_09580 [Lachnospiraceae bacterium]|nr:hypothetical protein [Lachnospiraceae bacterium]
MILIWLIVALFSFFVFPTFRCMVLHPVSTVYYVVHDLILYFLRHKYNNLKTGEIVCFCGMFGRGKTLSAVHHVVAEKYMRKNGKKVWCPERKKLVRQRVHIISNVQLVGVPYERLESLEQIVSVSQVMHEYDMEHDCKTCVLVLGDEFSVQLNSRNFKSNIDPLFLNTVLTCRHHNIALYLTAQRFSHMDALMRQVTLYVVECSKFWRFQRLKYYDAWELEQSGTPANVRQCRPAGCWFVRDRDYGRYDTMACVDNLRKTMENGGMLSEAEILALQCNTPSDMDAVAHKSGRYIRAQRKLNKQ